MSNSIENRSLPSIPMKHHKEQETNKNTNKTNTEAKHESHRNYTIFSDLSEDRNSVITKQLYNNFKSKLMNSNITIYKTLVQSDDESVYTETSKGIPLPKLQVIECQFLRLVSEDDVNGVQEFLLAFPGFNVNCINFQGISALHIAVQNRSEAMVELLLNQPNIETRDTVLHAVRDNSIKILVHLLNFQKKISPGLEFAGVTHSTDFPEHVTPLILAAQAGHYEVVALLVSRGHSIVRPHQPMCSCAECRRSLASEDPLYTSSARLSVYRAIASPAYLVHVCSDPILAALRLSVELSENASAYRPLAAAYLQLRDDVSAFAVDLLGCCRTSEEVEIVMKQTSGYKGRRQFELPRLLMAVECRQKCFVAHPNTQQILESHWLGDWYSWRNKCKVSKAITIASRVVITPFILLMCILAPRSRLVRHWQIPLNKLITHASAYFVFLALIFYISNQDKSKQTRGPPNTGAEIPLFLYVCGYTWSAVRICVMQGPRRYFTVLWNWAEIIMLVLFAFTFIFWYMSAIDVTRKLEDDIERKYWDQYEPTLLAEGTFCLATIFAFFRILFLCQLNYHLGPLQVSLGKMTIDICKYIIVFTIIISAFTAGLARLYQYYDGMVYEDEFGMKTVQVSSFTSLSDTLNTLFWALFCMAPLESADVVLENTKDAKSPDRYKENRHAYTERIGYFCFGCFEVISVIVVLNMLIATMSNTFQRVTDNVAIEWTFGKTEVYVEYMLQTTLPPPYNLIPTASGIASIFDWILVKVSAPAGCHARCSLAYCCYIERDVEATVQKEFPALMSVLVQRYFRDKDSLLVGRKEIETELDAVRRDLSAIRYVVERKLKSEKVAKVQKVE